MAISVPIGTEHYIYLKEISDKLGLSLKKTIEHIVSVHYSEMIKNSVEEKNEKKRDYSPNRIHDIEMTAPSLNYQSNPSTVQIHAQENLFPNTIKNETPKPTKVTITPSKPVSSSSSQLINNTNALVENQESSPNPETFVVPFYNTVVQKCSSCGASKNSDAKFCSSCGHSF